MKQHLRIKEFYGTSENAVKIQVYTAVTAYCLVAIAERELDVGLDTYDVLRILSASLLVKMPLVDLLRADYDKSARESEKGMAMPPVHRQLSLPFDDW